jgi:TatA/E family protein of Tat protein translocase
MPGFIGFPEILLLGLVVLLVFGPKRLPEMGRSLGKGMREFKDSVTGDHKDDAHHIDVLAVPVEDQPPMLGEIVVPKRREVA